MTTLGCAPMISAMAIYVIVKVAERRKMEAALKAHFPKDHFILDSGEYLVSSTATTQEVADRLGILDEKGAGAAVVFRVTTYDGNSDPEVWEWLQSKLRAPNG